MTRVEAHLHIGRARKGISTCISARNLPTGRVWYTSNLVLADATFAVQPAGLRRFRETGQKNVHAFVRGQFVPSRDYLPEANWRAASYNPLRDESFVDKINGERVDSASFIVLSGKNVWYIK